MAPLLFVIEIFSHAIRPVTLAFRLFANINGDHLVVGAISQMVPFGIPIIFLAFGIFVSFIQAFVFTLLSTIYIAMAVETHGQHDDHHATELQPSH
jgi:F-type H+-transporting ATPase subunit a